MKNNQFVFKALFYEFVAIIFILILFTGGSLAFASNFEYWNSESASLKFHEDFKLKIDQEFRFATNGKGFYREHTDFGLMYGGLSKYLDVGVNYRIVLEKNSKKSWLGQNRVYFQAKLKGEMAGFDLSNRSQFEYRAKNSHYDYWLYRNKSTVKFPFKFTKFDARPYVAHEFYVHFKKREVSRNRVWGGIGFDIYKKLTGDVYYMWQADKHHDSWLSRNIFGSKLKIKF